VQQLHREDYPRTLAIFDALFGWRLADAERIGFEVTGMVAHVDWTALDASWLSSTEKATVHLARGLAALERHGTLPASLAGPVTAAVESLVTDRRERRDLVSLRSVIGKVFEAGADIAMTPDGGAHLLIGVLVEHRDRQDAAGLVVVLTGAEKRAVMSALEPGSKARS
jgi:hypothetical protein